MADLTNLSEEECALLIELLEDARHGAKRAAGPPQSPGRLKDKSRRQEVLGRLLWHVRVVCHKPSMLDRDLITERLGGYC